MLSVATGFEQRNFLHVRNVVYWCSIIEVPGAILSSIQVDSVVIELGIKCPPVYLQVRGHPFLAASFFKSLIPNQA